MMNPRGWLIVAIWTLALVAAAGAKSDATADQTRWEIDCAAVRQFVAAYGENGAAALARGYGVPDAVIRRAKACLRK